MLLPITLTIAAGATLLNLWIAFRVVAARRSAKVSIGDGGNPVLTGRMRAHANYVEYTPFFLILLGLIEMAQGSTFWLWGAGILFILGRIAHVFGMDSAKVSPLRMIGIIVTITVLLGLAIYALMIAYQAPAITGTGIRIAPVSEA